MWASRFFFGHDYFVPVRIALFACGRLHGLRAFAERYIHGGGLKSVYRSQYREKGKNLVWQSVRQRIGSHLKLIKLGTLRRSAFVMEYRASACRGPQSFALPASVRIVNAAIHVLAEKTHRVRDMNVHEFSVHESQ